MPDETAGPATIRKITCPQCGASVEVPLGADHITCPYCGSAVEVRVGIYQGEFWARPVFDQSAATERFFRWTAERDKPAPLSEKVELLGVTPVWVPTWHVREWKTGEGGAREISFSIQPGFADAGTYGALLPEKLPLQAIRPMTAELEGEKAGVDMKPEEKVTIAKSQGHDLDQLLLVYVPIYRVDYAYKGTQYRLLIEGMTGGVHARTYPKKSGWPYYLYTICFGILFILLSIPMMAGSDEGMSVGLTLLCAGMIISFPLSALIAYFLVKKV